MRVLMTLCIILQFESMTHQLFVSQSMTSVECGLFYICRPEWVCCMRVFRYANIECDGWIRWICDAFILVWSKRTCNLNLWYLRMYVYAILCVWPTLVVVQHFFSAPFDDEIIFRFESINKCYFGNAWTHAKYVSCRRCIIASFTIFFPSIFLLSM